MLEQNIDFQEKYKRLDNLCKDCYNSQDGVSEYIRLMEKSMYEGIRLVKDWELVYKNLKHIRWIRNQLAHEVGTLNSNIVEEEDILFVFGFYKNMLNANDPLSKMRKLKSNQNNNRALTPNYNTPRESQRQPIPRKKHTNILSKLFNKIKNFFR